MTSFLCLLFPQKTVHCSTKNAYTSEITFLALHPCSKQPITAPYIHKVLPCTTICLAYAELDADFIQIESFYFILFLLDLKKPELTCISEEGIADMDIPDNLLDELDFLDNITSCAKVL